MSILATINPGNIQVAANTAFTASDVRTLVLDATAEDTVSQWMLPGGVMHTAGMTKLVMPHSLDVWAHGRIKASVIDDSETFVFRFNTDTDHILIIVSSSGKLTTVINSSADAAEDMGVPLVVDTWIDIDVKMSTTDDTIGIYISGVLVHEVSRTLGTELIESVFVGTSANFRAAELLFSANDTRGWKVQSSAPLTMNDSTYDGAASAVTNIALTSESLRSVGAGTTADFTYGTVPTNMKVAGISIGAVGQTLGKPDTPVIAHYLVENSNQHFIGMSVLNDDSEETPEFNFIASNPVTGKDFTPAEINVSEVRTVNAVEFTTLTVGSRNASRYGYWKDYLLDGSDQERGLMSVQWPGDAFYFLSFDTVAGELQMQSVSKGKWNSADSLVLVFLDSTGQTYQITVEWDNDPTEPMYKAPLLANVSQDWLKDRDAQDIKIFVFEQ